ncbi:hypothetical protein F5Y10DRAFT_290149 [Nemania abortiva]|nr:hypothetical protein F5Y10DRAFT_290149 [Nemania abortiva]
MPPFRRTRTGCSSCKVYGYKCDEKKPECSRCERLQIPDCSYDLTLKWQGPIKPQRLVKSPKAPRQDHVDYDDTQRLSSVPSLTSSGTTENAKPVDSYDLNSGWRVGWRLRWNSARKPDQDSTFEPISNPTPELTSKPPPSPDSYSLLSSDSDRDPDDYTPATTLGTEDLVFQPATNGKEKTGKKEKDHSDDSISSLLLVQANENSSALETCHPFHASVLWPRQDHLPHTALSESNTEGDLSKSMVKRDLSDATTDGECSWTSSGDESFTTAKENAGTRKEEIIGKIILATTTWLRFRFIQLRKVAAETTTNSSEGGSTPHNTLAQSSQGQAQSTQKRKLSDRNDDQGENDDEDTNGPPHSRADIKGKGKEVLRFACPYFKYNPTKYQHWPICPGPGWLNVHRLKEHLYRKHRQARFRCVRCWEHFESEQSYFDHQRALVPCELEEREPIDGFDAEQERQLKSRKKKGHIVSEIDKWRAVFQILFPHVSADQIPSPFYEYEQLTSPTAQAHETLTQCEEYVLRGLQQQAVESARAIVANLFQEFRTLQQQDMAPATTSVHGESQGHAGPSSSEAHTSRPDPMENNRAIFDLPEFDLDFLLGADGSLSLFQDVLREDIPEAPTDPENCALKQSDSGYGSNNQERPDE